MQVTAPGSWAGRGYYFTKETYFLQNIAGGAPGGPVLVWDKFWWQSGAYGFRGIRARGAPGPRAPWCTLARNVVQLGVWAGYRKLYLCRYGRYPLGLNGADHAMSARNSETALQ